MATRKPKINLATAQVADGALRSPRSIYEICGIASTPYRANNLVDYSAGIKAMSLDELHDHAFKVGVLAGPNRDTLLDRLEQKFLQEQGRFHPAIGQKIAMAAGTDAAIQAAAEKTISRGR